MIFIIRLIILFYPLIPSFLSQNYTYKTYGYLKNELNASLSGLDVTLNYSSINMTFFNLSDSDGYFYFEFFYTLTSILTGEITISDPQNIYETYTHEVDNYLGTNFECNLGVLIIELNQYHAQAFLFVNATFVDTDLGDSEINDLNVSLLVTQASEITPIFYENFTTNSTFYEEINFVINFSLPLQYNFSLIVSKVCFTSVEKSLVFSLNNTNEDQYLTVFNESVALEHIETESEINGTVMDKVLDTYISGALIISTMTCIETSSLELVEVSSSSDGTFTVTSTVYAGFAYVVALSFEESEFQTLSLTLYLNTTNNYTIYLNDVWLLRTEETAYVYGYLLDAVTKMPMIECGVRIKDINLTNQTDTKGYFIIYFMVFEGLEYDFSFVYPDNYTNTTNVSFYISETVSISCTEDNDYEENLGNLLVYRENTTFDLEVGFQRNFSMDSVIDFSLFLNLSMPTYNILLTYNLEIPINQTEIYTSLTGSIPSALNYSGTILMQSNSADAPKVSFIINTENNYSLDLGVIILEGVTQKITVVGQIEDSTTASGLTNVTVDFLLLENNIGFIAEAEGLTDSNGNFSITAKDSLNITRNYTFLAIFAATKLFYTAFYENFTINTSEIDSQRFMFIDLGVISLTPDYTTGTINGILIDVVVNEVLTGYVLLISVFGGDGALISFNQLTSNAYGKFSLSSEFEKGVNYTININVEGGDSFETFNKNFWLNIENNYTIDVVLLFLRNKAEVTIEGTLYDNYTSSPLENVTENITISFERNNNICLMSNNSNNFDLKWQNYSIETNNYTNFTNQSEYSKNNSYNLTKQNDSFLLQDNIGDCEGFDLFTEIPDAIISLSSSSVNISFRNVSNIYGKIYLTVSLWVGVDYNLTLNFEHKYFISLINSYAIDLTTDSDYTLSLGQLMMLRKMTNGLLLGYVNETTTGLPLKNVSIFGQMYENNHIFGDEFSTFSNESGFYIMNTTDLLEGLSYIINTEYYLEFFYILQEGISFDFIEENEIFYAEANISLTRKDAVFEIYGQIYSELKNLTISNAKIFCNISFFDKVIYIKNTTSSLNGSFSLYLNENVYQGINYQVLLIVESGFPYMNFSELFNLTLNSTRSIVDAGIIFVKTNEILLNISGFTKDSDDGSDIQNANISVFFQDNDTNCSSENTGCVEFNLSSIKTAENGFFLLFDYGFLGENYVFFLDIEADFFIQTNNISGYLNLTNNYSYFYDSLYVERKKVIGRVNFSIIDNLTSAFLTNYQIKYNLSYIYMKNQTEYTYSSSELLNITQNNGTFSFVEFLLGLGRNYSLSLIFIKTYYASYELNIELNMLNNYTVEINTISLNRNIRNVDISGIVYDNLTSLGIMNASVNLTLTPYTQSFVVFTNVSGNYSLENVSLYEGMTYLTTFIVNQEEFQTITRRNLILTTNNVTNFSYIFVMNRKNITFLIIGTVLNEEGQGISNASITIEISVYNFTNISPLLFYTNTSDNGNFSINNTALSLYLLNCSILAAKEGYTSQVIQSNISKDLNYTLLETITLSEELMSETGESSSVVSSEYTEEITFQIICYSFCQNNQLIYVSNAQVSLSAQGKTLTTTNSSTIGFVDLEAPLVFYGNSNFAATYEGTIDIVKDGYYSREIEVTIGGSSWEKGINLGEIQLIEEFCM